MKVDKQKLKQEKEVYGSDFTPICDSWSLYLGIAKNYKQYEQL